MKAAYIEEFGGNEKIVLGELPDPEPAKGEVQIAIQYSSVNPVDWKIREGCLVSVFNCQFPLVLGWDAAGTIAKVGEGVTAWKEGDEVYAYCKKDPVQWGTFCEKVCVPESFVAAKPKSLTMAEAAGFPLVALTAWQVFFDFAGLQEGASILIHGGAGGVGSVAVPLARYMGCTVFTTASARNHDYLLERGASEVVDYNTESIADWADRREPDGFDLILDCVGGEALEMSYDRVRPAGHLITIAAPINHQRASKRHVRSASLIVRPSGAQLSEIAHLIDSGILPTPDITEMPLDEIKEALDKNREGHTRGKIVIKIN